MRLVLPLLTLLSVVACVEPEQYGGPIPIDTFGVEARLAHMCAVAPQPMCGAIAEPVEPADDEAGPAPDASTPVQSFESRAGEH